MCHALSHSFCRGRDLGFSLDEVRELLRLSDDREQSCADVDRIARSHLIEVERKVANLMALGVKLRQLIDKCQRDTIAECRIIEALAPAGHMACRRGRGDKSRGPGPCCRARRHAEIILLWGSFTRFLTLRVSTMRRA
jgi:MerR, DNA binding